MLLQVRDDARAEHVDRRAVEPQVFAGADEVALAFEVREQVTEAVDGDVLLDGPVAEIRWLEARVVRSATGVLAAAAVAALLISGIGATGRHETVTALARLNDELESALDGLERGRAGAAKIARRSVDGIEVSDPKIADLRDRASQLLSIVDVDDLLSVQALRLTAIEVVEVFAERAPDWFIRVSNK